MSGSSLNINQCSMQIFLEVLLVEAMYYTLGQKNCFEPVLFFKVI